MSLAAVCLLRQFSITRFACRQKLPPNKLLQLTKRVPGRKRITFATGERATQEAAGWDSLHVQAEPLFGRDTAITSKRKLCVLKRSRAAFSQQQSQELQARLTLLNSTSTIRGNQNTAAPHADGRRIICKHMVAAYFTAFPEEAEKFYTEAMAYQEEEEKRQEAVSCISKAPPLPAADRAGRGRSH